MTRRTVQVAVVLVAVVVSSATVRAESSADAEPDAGPSPMTTSAAREAVVATVPSVEMIRGLEFKTPVSVEVVDDAVARDHALDRLDAFYDDEMIQGMQTGYILLGLLPEGTDVLAQYLAFIEEQVGGFYDPSEKSFFLLDDMPAGVAPMLAAHELTHALEDQHFDLDARLEAAMPDDDRVFAVGAVHEGSAYLVMSLYVLRAMAEGTLTAEDLQEMAESDAARGETLAAMPPALKRPIITSYVLGMTFLLRGDAGAFVNGFPTEDVDGCERGGPTSSEQILHPEKYWDPERRDDPVAIEPFAASKVLGRKWKRTASGNLGELVIGVMAGAPTPPGLEGMSATDPSQWTHRAAEGWGGDRWELWRRGDQAVVLLAAEWDTPEDAREFNVALRPGDGITWKLRGTRVAVVGGAAGGKTDRLLDLLLKP
jgi:hypothetical protein